MEPLPIPWVDRMPLWCRLRYKKVFFEYFLTMQNGTATPPAAMESMVRIELSMPHTALFDLCNTFRHCNTIFRSKDVYGKHFEDNSKKLMLHMWLEFLCFRFDHMLPTQSKGTLYWLQWFLPCLNTAKDRQMYSMLSLMIMKILQSPNKDIKYIPSLSKAWISNCEQVNRLLVLSFVRYGSFFLFFSLSLSLNYAVIVHEQCVYFYLN